MFSERFVRLWSGGGVGNWQEDYHLVVVGVKNYGNTLDVRENTRKSGVQNTKNCTTRSRRRSQNKGAFDWPSA